MCTTCQQRSENLVEDYLPHGDVQSCCSQYREEHASELPDACIVGEVTAQEVQRSETRAQKSMGLVMISSCLAALNRSSSGTTTVSHSRLQPCHCPFAAVVPAGVHNKQELGPGAKGSGHIWQRTGPDPVSTRIPQISLCSSAPAAGWRQVKSLAQLLKARSHNHVVPGSSS